MIITSRSFYMQQLYNLSNLNAPFLGTKMISNFYSLYLLDIDLCLAVLVILQQPNLLIIHTNKLSFACSWG